MEDKELLESAAKAANIESFGFDAKGNLCLDPYVYCPWNPLEDDGDRYRLAKKLDIRIHFGPAYVTYSAAGRCGSVRWPEDAKNDAYAVVMAAAEMGRVMP